MTVRPIETLNQKPHTRRRRGRARPARRAAGQSPISDGAISRTHFADACASQWLDGELVHLDDLVLHDAGMDVRTPTHELTRAHAVLRARRRIAEAKPDWALSDAGLAGLRGRGEREEEKGNRNNDEESFGLGNEGAERDEAGLEGPLGILDTDPHLAAAFAAVDAANAKAERTLADETRARPERDPPSLRSRLGRGRPSRPLAHRGRPDSRLAADAWDAIEPLEHTAWLGLLLAAALLRDRGKTRWHLPCLHAGLKSIRVSVGGRATPRRGSPCSSRR
jgi:Protein of unknown function (DUF1612)